MNFDISELEQIITEELDAVLTPTEVSPLDRYILSEKAQTTGVPTPPHLRRRYRRQRYRRMLQRKTRKQAILLKRINKDKSGTSKGANITLQDIQKALASVSVSAKFAKKAKSGVYDRNTYRAIVAFQRKYRGELKDKRLDGLVGPSTVGVLRRYDKSGVFSKKLDTKGVAIGASDKMLKGLDKVAASKPGPERLKALTNLAIQQPDSFIKYFRQLRKQIPSRGGIAKLSEKENIIEPENVTGGYV